MVNKRLLKMAAKFETKTVKKAGISLPGSLTADELKEVKSYAKFLISKRAYKKELNFDLDPEMNELPSDESDDFDFDRDDSLINNKYNKTRQEEIEDKIDSPDGDDQSLFGNIKERALIDPFEDEDDELDEDDDSLDDFDDNDEEEDIGLKRSDIKKYKEKHNTEDY